MNEEDKLVGKAIEGREKLATLYPKPKTYDDLQADRKRIDLLRQSREPKYPEIRVVAELGGIVVLALLIFYTVPAVVLFSPLAGVCISLLLILIWCGLVWVHVRRSSDVFQRFRLPHALFVVAYVFSVLPMVAASFKVFEGVQSGVRMPLLLLFIFTLQAIVASVIISILKRSGMSDALRLVSIGVIIAVFMISAVVLL